MACKVEFAWWRFPDDRLASNRRYFKNRTEAEAFCQYLADNHYYAWRIIERPKAIGTTESA